MKNNKYLLAALLCVYGTVASASILVTSRNSTSDASAYHQTLTGQDQAHEEDSDASTTILGSSGSSATLVPLYNYGANAGTSVSLSANTLSISGSAGAGEPNSGSFSSTIANSHIELYFTVDSLTHVDIELNETRINQNLSTGLMQLFYGNTLLASVSSETDFNQKVPFPENLSLDLAAGNYKIVGNYSTRAFYDTCGGRSCSAYGSMTLTTSSSISAIPLPSAILLMGSSLIGLLATKKQKYFHRRS